MGCGSDDPAGPTGSVTVLAASPLRPALEEIGRRFESANPGAKVVLRFGASRALLRQVDPSMYLGCKCVADVFASSDPVALHGLTGNDELGGNDEVTGNATNETPFGYDAQEIVTAPGNPQRVATLHDLARPGLRVALVRRGDKAGVLARQALAKAHVTVHHALKAYNPAAALAAVAAGRADAAIVSAVQAHAAATKLTQIAIPAAQNAVTSFNAAQPVDSRNRPLGDRFMAFLVTDEARDALRDHGVQTDDAS